MLPPLVAFEKFSAVGGSALVLFAGGPAWFFHLAVPVSALADLEEIAITLVLPQRQANVHSFWHVRHAQRHV